MRIGRMVKTFFKVLRAKIALAILDYITHPEIIPLTVHGRYIVEEGDVAILKLADGDVELGKIMRAPVEVGTVHMRIYRRPRWNY